MYIGVRIPDGGARVRVVDPPWNYNPPQDPLLEECTIELNPRLDLRNHSPTGLEWGYGGSGPAQLALALLADATGDDVYACSFYQQFKWEVVARWDQEEGWWQTHAGIMKWVAAHPMLDGGNDGGNKTQADAP